MIRLWLACRNISVKTDYREFARFDDIAKHVSGTYGRKLVGVAHQDQNGLRRDRLEQVVGDYYVHHGNFVHDHEVGGKRFLLVSLKPAHLGTEFEQPVNRRGRMPRGLREPLCRAAGGRRQADARPDAFVYGKNRPHQGGFAGARSSRYYDDFFAEGQLDRFFLKGSEREIQASADPIESVL